MTKNQKIRKSQNKKLIEAALRFASGQYVETEEVCKIKTYEEIGGEVKAVEKIAIVPLKKFVPPSAIIAKYLLESYERETTPQKSNEEHILVLSPEIMRYEQTEEEYEAYKQEYKEKYPEQYAEQYPEGCNQSYNS